MLDTLLSCHFKFYSNKYSKVILGIPRCNSCADIQYNAEDTASLIAIPIALLLAGLSYYFLSGIEKILIGSVIGLVIAIVFKMFYQKYAVRKKGILLRNEGSQNDPTIDSLLAMGWSFIPPQA